MENSRDSLVCILAGGLGIRIGGNKPFYEFRGKALIQWSLEIAKKSNSKIIISTASEANSKNIACLGYDLVFDGEFAGFGPLAGIYAALEYAKENGFEFFISIPCDMPSLPEYYFNNLIKESRKNDAPIIFYQGNQEYPLCALWRIGVLENLRQALQNSQGGAKVKKFLADNGADFCKVKDEENFININEKV